MPSRSGRRGTAVLVGAVALVVVGAGAYAVPRLVPGVDSLTAVPSTVASALTDDASTSPSPVPASPTPAGGGGASSPKPSASSTAKGSNARTSGSTTAGSKKTGSGSSTGGTSRNEVPVPATGPGTYTVATERAAPATQRGRLYRFDVRVEKGLDIDADKAALAIAKTLNDERSWRGTGRWRFQLVPAGSYADLHAYIVTPGTTDRLCAPLLTRGEVSCQAGDKVVLNAKRWLRGADAYGDDVAGYRQYLVNHEFGHALGHGHLTCPRSGAPAPVMLQQTKGLGGCTKNPWPMTTGD